MNFFNQYRPNTVYESIYTDLINKRILYMNDDVTDMLIDMIALPIITLNEEEKDIPEEKLKPITIYINSNGGDANVCTYLVEIIEKSRIPIHCRVFSVAASAGLYIALACHKRYSSKNSIFLLHKGSVAFMGNTGEAEDFIEFYKEEIGTIFDDLILRRTKITAEELKKIRRNETYCLGQEALEKYGFIDEII